MTHSNNALPEIRVEEWLADGSRAASVDAEIGMLAEVLHAIVHAGAGVSRYNKFEGLGGPRGLRPGLCTTYLVKNPTSKTITLALFDQIHGRQRILIAVLAADAADEGEEDTPTQKPAEELPSRCPGSFAGTWKTGYGTMTITFTSPNEVVGTYDYDGGSIKGSVSSDGQVLDGTYAENKGQGRFRFTLESGGSRFKGNWNRTSGTREPPSGTWEGKCLSE